MISRNDLFIASRLSSASDGKSVMVHIAVVSVAISIAVMIISLAVVGGFKREIESKITGFGASYQILNIASAATGESVPLQLNGKLLRGLNNLPDVDGGYAFVAKEGMIRSQDALAGVMLKGVGSDFDTTFFARHITQGSMPRIVDSVRTKDILISQTLATTLSMGVGERIEMMFIDHGLNGAPSTRRDRFKISGLYSTGFRDMDMLMTFTDMRNVQRLNNWDNNTITGYEVVTSSSTTDVRQSIEAVTDVFGEDGGRMLVLDAASRFPALFDWLAMHRVNGVVIITIMFLVALLNCTASLLIILLERTRMIGILKALGMRDGKIELIFIMRSMFIILRGLIAGSLVAMVLMWLQDRYSLLKLDEATYFLSAVPVDWGWWILWLNVGLLAALLVMMALPAMLVTSIKPEKSIRYQ